MRTLLCTLLALTGLPGLHAAALPYSERRTSRSPDTEETNGDCPVARTGHGIVRGVHLNEDVYAFLGVPYAQPPVGDLRWRPPQPLVASSDKANDVIDATKFGPVCHQFHNRQVLLNNTIETTPQSEDCLNINIFVPRKAPDSPLLPTLLYAYGGGFVEGGGSVPIFDPRGLVASQGNIIVVTFNIRGTIFGFPNSPALPIDQQNLGIRDERAALEWLRDNLAAFGGDPEQITVGGQSSGADGWAALAYTYPNDYIARGMLLESGHPLAAEPSGDPSEEFHRVAGEVGCRNKSDSAEELRCMKTIPAQTIRDAISPNFINAFATPNGGSPVIDNITLFAPEEYLKLGNAGKFAKVPVFMGLNDQEGDSVQNWSPKCGINQTFSNIWTFSFFECPMTLEASYRTKWNVPIWRYRYFGTFAADTFFDWLGPYHSAEIPFVLGSYRNLKPSRPISSDEHKSAKMFQDAVGAFVRSPQTGLSKDIGWPAYDPRSRPHCEINLGSRVPLAARSDLANYIAETTLVELFRDNKPSYKLADPQQYYSGCDNPPPVPWSEVAKPPPTC